MSWSVWTVFSDFDHCQGHFMAKYCLLVCWGVGMLVDRAEGCKGADQTHMLREKTDCLASWL